MIGSRAEAFHTTSPRRLQQLQGRSGGHAAVRRMSLNSFDARDEDGISVERESGVRSMEMLNAQMYPD